MKTNYLISGLILASLSFNAQTIINTTGNTNLACINVDNVASSNLANGWNIDDNSQYSEDCSVTLSNLEFEHSPFTIYPNPAIDNVTINSLKKGEVSIFDMSGKEVIIKKTISAGSTKIETNQLTPQLYLISVAIGEQVHTQKLIIQ